jgi:hypothetical protein
MLTGGWADGECVHSAREVAKIEKAVPAGQFIFFGKLDLSVNLSLARLADPAQIIGCCGDVDSTP